MSETEKSNLAQLIVLALALVAWAAFIWDASGHYASQRTRAEAAATQYAQKADEQIERACAALTGAALRKCIREQVEANRSDQRSEHDLTAQQEMADWSFWVMIVSAVTMVLTGIALWFVKGTLDATREAVKDTSEATVAMREANRIAEEASQTQLRAYMAVVSVEVEEPILDELGWGSQLIVKIRNNGQTPAEITRLAFNALWHANNLCTTLLDIEKHTGFRVPTSGEPLSMPVRIWAAGEGLDEPGQMFAAITLDYKDVFDHEHSETFCYHFGNNKLPFQRLDFPFFMSGLPGKDLLDMLGDGDGESQK